MSIIIRLQNLPWAATCMDIRRYFWGLSIPEGGVHIVGGEMGDAFIGFSTDEDARQAMSRDGGKIHEMQIRLLLSSHAEMMRVIEKARQQNMALQSNVMPPAPAPQPQVMPVTQPMQQMMPVTQPSQMMQVTQPSQMMTQPPQQMMPVTQPQQMMPLAQPPQQQPMPQQMAQQDDRGGRRGRSPSPARRPRDRSPVRSSSDRNRRSSSKRDRSRSPPRGSRASSSDYRRGDRKRDDRGYDDRSYRDDRYRKSYPDNSRDRRYYDNQASNSPSYGSYDRSKSSSNSYSSSNNDKGSAPSQQQSSFPAGSNNYGGSSGGNSSYDHSAMPSNSSKPAAEEFPKRRRSRFDPDPPTTSSDLPFFDTEQKNKLAEALRALPNLPLVTGKPTGQEYSSSTNATWPQQTSNQESNPQSIWPKLEKRNPNQGVVPMDLESSPTSSPPPDNSSKIIVNQPYNSPRDSHSFVHGSNDMPSRNHPSAPDQKDRFMNKPNQPQWSAPSPSSLTVEVRGPPPDVKVNEILDLFHSATLAPANIFILKNQRGEADKALVQFQKLADAQTALSRQPCYIRNYCVEVVSCPDALFKAAIANATSQMKPVFKPRPKEEDWCVQMSGFTFPCTEPDIGRILGGIRIVDLAIDDEKGCAFVQLSSDQDFRCALSMSGKTFGQGYITISVSSKEFLNAARGSSEQRRGQNNFGGPSNPGRRPFNENPNGPMHENGPPVPVSPNRPQNYAVHLRQLPQHVTDKAINEFFKEAGVVVKAIHILLTPEKVPSGEGFIEVGAKEEVDIALTRHNTMFLGRPIQVSPIPFHEMTLILNPPGLLPTPEELARRGRERPYNEPEFEAPPNGRPPRKEFFDGPGHPPPRGERPFFPPDRPRPDFRGERPYFPRQRGERSRMDGPPMRGPRPPMRPPFGRMRGPFPQRPRGPPWDPSRAREQGEIGAPGCVVNIDNLHFDAGFEEILEFFKGYGILRDNIIRKYDERKQPTSKARVAFHTPWDAERAVRELNHEMIKGRPLNLSIL